MCANAIAYLNFDAFRRTLYQQIGFEGVVAFLEVFRVENIPGLCESSSVMENQFSVMLLSYLAVRCLLLDFRLLYDMCVQCFQYS